MKRHLPLLLPLLLLGALAISQGGAAASTARPTPAFGHPTLRDAATESEEEGEEIEFEEEFEFGECESAAEEIEFEDEEPLEDEEEDEAFEASCGGAAARKAIPKGTPFVTAPVACQVRQAESTITTLPASDQVRLTVRYRTYAPTGVTVGLSLKDRKGSVAIAHTTRHLGGEGVLHLTTKLGAAVMERALRASEFDVSLRAPATPGFCADALAQRLHSVAHTGARTPRVYAG